MRAYILVCLAFGVATANPAIGLSEFGELQEPGPVILGGETEQKPVSFVLY